LLSLSLRLTSFEAILRPMQRLSRLLALLAAVMLVIGGAPAVAAAQPCNPCPPDCPMMQQMAASADHHAPTPAKDSQPGNPCKQGLACAAFTAAVAAPSETFALGGDAVEHRLADALAAPSRPPDRNLRPPIQL
jgi:hypothetical protein